ncbi:hypothetical protein QTG56_23970 (plasmid) [Rossellomorea sp. AcN35-11]|nr:hypothetical protein [Rossellomorea aquimaris]WJV31696.1 hypothetical protein QTG56_23970 [Rossellomorea sp. AcN35-11]
MEKLIQSKMEESTPLTKEELNDELLKMKDEKIENLEGNISTILGTMGVIVGIAALLLTIVTIFIGRWVKGNVDEKLKRIEEIETKISSQESNTIANLSGIKEYYTKIKDFADEVDKTQKKLKKNEELLEEQLKDMDSLRSYIGVIEDLTECSNVALGFLNETQQISNIYEETKDVLNNRHKNPEYVVLKISQKLNMQDELTNLEEINEHLEDLMKNLKEEEKNFWDFFKGKKVINQYIYDDKDGSTLTEELKAHYRDWRGYLEDIQTIKNFCEAQLSMNPTDQNDTE